MTEFQAWIMVLAQIIGLGVVIYNQIQSAKQVEKIEVATNSMKDALVTAVGEEALARGKLEGAAAEAAKQSK